MICPNLQFDFLNLILTRFQNFYALFVKRTSVYGWPKPNPRSNDPGPLETHLPFLLSSDDKYFPHIASKCSYFANKTTIRFPYCRVSWAESFNADIIDNIIFSVRSRVSASALCGEIIINVCSIYRAVSSRAATFLDLLWLWKQEISLWEDPVVSDITKI